MKYEVEFTDWSQVDAIEIRLHDALKEGPHLITIKKISKQRSSLQNNSLHKYCEDMSRKLNDAGYTQRKLVTKFKDGFELPITMHGVKEIFRKVGFDLFEKASTADLTTVEIQEVYKSVDKGFGELTGIRVDWPSRFRGSDER